MDLLQPDYGLMIVTLIAFALATVGVLWAIRRVLRGALGSRSQKQESEARLQLSERLESLAEETERLREGQRFTEGALLARKHPKGDRS